MATTLITVDCKPFQIMPYIVIPKVRRFHQPTANCFSTVKKKLVRRVGTLFDMRGGIMAQQNVFAHCAQTLRWKKLKLGEFNINLCRIKRYLWFPRLSGVTMATSLSGSTRDFLKLSFHMFPYKLKKSFQK